MQNLSFDILMKYMSSNIRWKLASSGILDDGTAVRNYESDSLLKGRKYHKQEVRSVAGIKYLLTLS